MKTERWWQDAAGSVGEYERIEGEWRRVNVTPVDVAWLWSQVAAAACCEFANEVLEVWREVGAETRWDFGSDLREEWWGWKEEGEER
jgi:hypothetical protein